eukprot:CAMPEP_0170621320 /NCGR_PEP_ID=MMETSP0224-20130122/28538_1 /TAXON_ID=285029 /ORGANISM="Togula jolla, Strain CCCM 725" /LENGTH=596 /DNA_ID=CAMNT_0010947571 /DNA_START=62 /DNA_END=1853 /DNA_ORIENTATION=-
MLSFVSSRPSAILLLSAVLRTAARDSTEQTAVAAPEVSKAADIFIVEGFLEAACTVGAFVAVAAARGAFSFWRPKATSRGPRADKLVDNSEDSHSSGPSKQCLRSVARPSFSSSSSPSRSSSETDALAAAVRYGRAWELPSLLDKARARAQEYSSESIEICEVKHLTSSIRACAARRCFREALRAYDHVAGRIGEGSVGMWSLLLYCSAEAAEFRRCGFFWTKICSIAQPASQDFVNMVRWKAHMGDVEGLRLVLSQLQSAGFQLSGLDRNRALAVCAMGGSLDLAELLSESDICDAEMDTVTYNTLMKAASQAGLPQRCFEFSSQMREAGLLPSEMTFGILLEACVAAKDFTTATETFQDLRKSAIIPNAVHFTTFLKGLVCSGQLIAAEALLEEMLTSAGTQPDLVTYSILVKAYADRGEVSSAVRILEKMVKQGIMPDAVMFNIILTGCCAEPTDAAEVSRVLDWSLQHGLKPSTTTLSILVKALSQTESWDSACEILETAPRRLGLWPEARIFAQLLQGCIKSGNGRKAVEVYSLMAKAVKSGGITVDEVTSTKLLVFVVPVASTRQPAVSMPSFAGWDEGGASRRTAQQNA